MGIWPGEHQYAQHYEYCEEYVSILQDLCSIGSSDRKGEFFKMNDCRCLPLPISKVEIVCAGQSDRGTKFASEYADHNFVASSGFNTPGTVGKVVTRLVAENARTGRSCGALVLIMVITDETDAAAEAKWEHYKSGTDYQALAWRDGQANNDTVKDPFSVAGRFNLSTEAKLPTNMGTLVGSYAKVAALLDELAEVPGVQGAMLTFDDFVVGMEQFGTRIQPLMKSRSNISLAA
jgi:pyrimidine oxygenase